MNFDKLNQMIPYVVGGKQKILEMRPYNAITLRMPGRHADQTSPVGGDFVVCVDDTYMDWTQHQFTHDDIFLDLEAKRKAHGEQVRILGSDYQRVINGESPPEWADGQYIGVHPTTFLHAVQCLAVAEHRRYAKYEPKFGGRFLPFRFASGIIEGLWTAHDAMAWQRKGRPGVEKLEKDFGMPVQTSTLMGLTATVGSGTL
jgi:hypothetical protein